MHSGQTHAHLARRAFRRRTPKPRIHESKLRTCTEPPYMEKAPPCCGLRGRLRLRERPQPALVCQGLRIARYWHVCACQVLHLLSVTHVLRLSTNPKPASDWGSGSAARRPLRAATGSVAVPAMRHQPLDVPPIPHLRKPEAQTSSAHLEDVGGGARRKRSCSSRDCVAPSSPRLEAACAASQSAQTSWTGLLWQQLSGHLAQSAAQAARGATPASVDLQGLVRQASQHLGLRCGLGLGGRRHHRGPRGRLRPGADVRHAGDGRRGLQVCRGAVRCADLSSACRHELHPLCMVSIPQHLRSHARAPQCTGYGTVVR